MASKGMTEQFVVGVVRGSHGISGEFKVESTSGEYGHFARMEEVVLSDGNSRKSFRIESIKTGSSILYMKLQGINSPEDAAFYNGWKIVVPRKNAHKLQKNEWYIEDLKGCFVWYKKETADSTAPAFDEESCVGTVTNVLEGGSGYLVEILLSESCGFLSRSVKFDRNGKSRKVFVPFKDEFIGEVDVENKKMRLMHLWILE
jgi:16S rRNA processing protein RimM